MYMVVDPGESTAIGYFRSDTKHWAPLLARASQTYHYSEDPTTNIWLVGLEDTIAKGTLTSIVVEQFRLYPHKAEAQIGSSFPTVEVIGILRYLSMKNSVPMVELTPGCKKPFDSVTLLKELYGVTNLDGLARTEHERDVLRLAMAFHRKLVLGQRS